VRLDPALRPRQPGLHRSAKLSCKGQIVPVMRRITMTHCHLVEHSLDQNACARVLISVLLGDVGSLGRYLGAGKRKPFRINESGLHQHRTLVPVNVLASDLAALEPNDHHGRDFGLTAGRTTPRRMKSITRSCVKAISISSTIWSSPAVRLIGVIVVSDDHWPMKLAW
jgi:hypothetical protein